jgi:hypothetical protein
MDQQRLLRTGTGPPEKVTSNYASKGFHRRRAFIPVGRLFQEHEGEPHYFKSGVPILMPDSERPLRASSNVR